MSWLLPQIWSRTSAPATEAADVRAIEEEEEDIDAPPPFPMLDSHQRSKSPPRAVPDPVVAAPKKAPIPTLSFAVAPPSPTHSVSDTEANDLNIAIVGDNIPTGNMAPPPSTVKKPNFGLQVGGIDEGSKEKKGGDVKKKRGGKVALAPGHSPLDWARLTSSGQNLRGVDSFQRVTLAELKEHKTSDDAWSAFNGMVYNITPYLPFHPGGEADLMRVAGRDGTKLFMVTHSWVNMDYMLKECMVGVLVQG